MAQYTQKLIFDNFKGMLEEMPFDKITVSSLVRRCGISPNTFYYHYDDIFDLLAKWLSCLLDTYISRFKGNVDWELAFKETLNDCKKNRNVINHIFYALSRDKMEQFEFLAASELAYRIVEEWTADYEVPEKELRELANYCEFAITGYCTKFIWSRMSMDIDEMVESIREMTDRLVRSTRERYPKKKK